MFQDEARFGRISDPRRCWAPYPQRPMAKAMIVREFTYAYAAVSPADGTLDSLVLPHVDTGCMQLFLDEVSRRHPTDNILMILDGAGWHRAQALRPPEHLQLMALPPYSPELNPVEHLWDELREKYFHNLAFDSLDAVEDQLVVALRAFENNPDQVKSITYWPWIKKIIMNAK